eukprot:Em0001g934a
MSYWTSLQHCLLKFATVLEPSLVYNPYLKYKTANDADDAPAVIVAENFWCRNRQKSCLDVKVFNPFAKSYVKESLTQCYHHLELNKKCAYDARVCEVELGCSHHSLRHSI